MYKTSPFQKFINTLVLIVFALWVWTLVEMFLPADEAIIPDEVAALDAEITNVLENVPANFTSLYDDQANLLSYSFRKLEERTALSDPDNYSRNVDSIVYITTEGVDGWQYLGSGSVIAEGGVIMTNYHVIEDSAKVVVTTSWGDHYPVIGVLATDELLDIAFIKVDVDGLTPIPLGNSDDARVGERTLVIGHAEGFMNTLSVGNIAGFRSYESYGAGTNIQITNPISMGNSGGAVLNEFGEIIGVPTWSLEYDDNAVQVQNLNFAVPINEALELLSQ